MPTWEVGTDVVILDSTCCSDLVGTVSSLVHRYLAAYRKKKKKRVSDTGVLDGVHHVRYGADAQS